MQGKRQDPHYQAEAILSRREHSIFEMQTKLRRHKFTNQQITAAIGGLKSRGLLNDARFAQAYIASTLRRKAVGPRWLHAKLVQKGVARSVIDEAVTAAFPSGGEENLARQAADSWRRTHSKYAHDTQRLARFLTSRGFARNAIAIVLGAGEEQ